MKVPDYHEVAFPILILLTIGVLFFSAGLKYSSGIKSASNGHEAILKCKIAITVVQEKD